MPAKAIETLYSLNGFAQGTQMPSVPRAQLRSIVERDALSCLGIDAAVAAPATESAARAAEHDPLQTTDA